MLKRSEHERVRVQQESFRSFSLRVSFLQTVNIDFLPLLAAFQPVFNN